MRIVSKITGPAERALEHNSRQVKEHNSRILVATYPEEKGHLGCRHHNKGMAAGYHKEGRA